MKTRSFLPVLLILFSCTGLLHSQTGIFTDDSEVGIEEHLDEIIPGDIMLVDESGRTVALEQMIDKPTIVNLVYYRCPGICSPIMEAIADVIDKMDLTLGEDFQVLTISFDPTESLDLARRKKNNYLNLMDTDTLARVHWKFFISDSASIARLTQAVGFKYKRTGNDFIHAGTIIIVSPERKITRYLNGTYFLPFEVKMSIIEASKGRSMPTVNRILQYCYSYDPAGQKYVMNITKVTGTVIIFFGLILFLYLVLKPAIRKKKLKTEN